MQALLLIDIQAGFQDPKWGNPSSNPFEAEVVHLLQHYRSMKKPVYHVQHLSQNPESPLRPGQDGVDFMNFAKPIHGERIFQKQANSAFIGTHLETVLRENKIQSLVICGIAADHCVSTTARMAANLGFSVFVVADAVLAHERRGLKGTLYEADLVHAVSLASLNGEFATVVKTGSELG